ncbi:MAG: NAD(P)/FAD-dependent oxidoreductase [Planctomycetota bacterium]
MPGSIAVIGAGIAGIACAQALQAAGRSVVLFDKGRSAGGRAATRRQNERRFDHGAQFFTARDNRFAAVVRRLEAQGSVARWSAPFRTLAAGQWGDDPRPGAVRYVGVPGMSALPRALAAELTVHASRRVERIDGAAGAYLLAVRDMTTSGGSAEASPTGTAQERQAYGPFERVVLAIPPRQADDLLRNSSICDGPVAERASALREALQPSLCAMVAFDPLEDAPLGGMFVSDDAALSWAAHDGGKPGRDGGASYVLHARADWSIANFDRDRELVSRELLAAFARVLGRPLPEPVHLVGHRWGFALVTADEADAASAQSSFAYDESRGLGLVGDALVAGRVEGAYLSGLDLASRLD